MRYFLDRGITVRRLRQKSGTHSAYSATGTVWQASFQDTAPDKVQYYNGQIGKTYDIYIPDSSVPISAGDQVIALNKRYSVVAKEVIDFGGVPYIALVAVRND